MRVLLVVVLVACSSPAHPKPPAPDPRWRADLQCREQPGCEGNGSSCNEMSMTSEPVRSCGPETAKQRRDREQRIAAHTWPCECFCSGDAPVAPRCIPVTAR